LYSRGRCSSEGLVVSEADDRTGRDVELIEAVVSLDERDLAVQLVLDDDVHLVLDLKENGQGRILW
jgi:hypothetical protein